MAFQPSPQYMQTVAQLESGGNPTAENPNSSATGLYQFTDPVAAEYGLTDPTDPVASTDAMKSLTADNYAALSKSLGRAPTEPELYLAHQQGATGAAKLLSDPDAPAVDVLGKKQVLNNGGNANMTAGDFANMWQGKYNKVAGFKDPIANGVQIADSGQIASDASNFGAGDDIVAPATPDAFGADDQTIAAAAVQHPKAVNDKFQPDTGKFRTAVDNFNNGTMMGFGGDITDALGKAYARTVMGSNDPALEAQIATMRQDNQAGMKAENAAHPWIAPAANIAGLLTGAVDLGGIGKAVLPESIISNVAKIAAENPYKTAALVSGSGQAVRDLGEAQQTGTGRFDNIGADVPIATVAGMGGVPIAKGLANVAGAAFDRFGQPIKDLIDDWRSGAGGGGVLGDDAAAAATAGEGGIPAGASPSNPQPVTAATTANMTTPMAVGGIDDPIGFARLSNDKYPVHLTQGDLTQNGAIQRNEQKAYELGSPEIKDAREIQKQDIQRPFESILGDNQSMDPLALNYRTQDEATNAANVVRDKYDNLRSIEKSAWKIAGQGDAGIASSAIQKDFIEPVSNELVDKGYVTGQVPKLDSKLQELTDIMQPDEDGTTSVTSVKLKAMDNWYKSLNQAKFTSDHISDPTIDMHVGTLKRNFQGFLDNLQDTSIVNGDQSAIQAFKTARAASSQRFGFYDTDKAVQRILDNRELSGTQAINTLWGATNISGKGSDGLLIPNIMEKLGDQAPQFREALQQGFAAKILGDGLGAHATEGKSVFDIAAGVNNSLKSLMRNKELFESVFPDPETQAYFKSYSDGVGKIAQKEVGAINRSGTAMSVIGAFGALSKLLIHLSGANVLSGGMAIAGANALLEKRAASEIMGKAAGGLGDFDDAALSKAFQQIDAKPAFYGGYVGGGALDPIAQSITGGTTNDSNRH